MTLYVCLHGCNVGYGTKFTQCRKVFLAFDCQRSVKERIGLLSRNNTPLISAIDQSESSIQPSHVITMTNYVSVVLFSVAQRFSNLLISRTPVTWTQVDPYPVVLLVPFIHSTLLHSTLTRFDQNGTEPPSVSSCEGSKNFFQYGCCLFITFSCLLSSLNAGMRCYSLFCSK